MKNIILLWLGLTLSLLAGEPRMWTNSEGKKIKAELLSYEGGKVTILMKGKKYTMSLDKFSEPDQAWLEEQRKAKWKALAGTTKRYVSDGKDKVPYHVYYPKNFNGDNPPPMLILFSSYGNGKDILNKVKAACEDRGWIGVGCDVFKNNMDDAMLDLKFAEMLPDLESKVPHNPEFLYTGGMSGGASRAYRSTEKFKRPWKGVLAFGGWLGGLKKLRCPRKMAVAMVNGDKDKAANMYIKPDSKVLKKRSCKIKAFHFPGGHVIAPKEVVINALRWIDENTYKPR